MTVQTEAHLLRIFIDEGSKRDHIPLYQWIVKKAQEQGIAGATVFRAMAGYGSHRVMHSSSILDISSNLPVVIEIVDQEEALVNLVRALSEVIKEGVATLEKVRIYKFGQTL